MNQDRYNQLFEYAQHRDIRSDEAEELFDEINRLRAVADTNSLMYQMREGDNEKQLKLLRLFVAEVARTQGTHIQVNRHARAEIPVDKVRVEASEGLTGTLTIQVKDFRWPPR